MRRATTVIVMTAALSLTCTACGTSAGTNAQSYFSNSKAILGTLFSSGHSSVAGSDTSDATAAAALNAPTEFTMSEDGTYSFVGNEDADYYLLYFCDPDTAEGDDSFIYSSEPIDGDQGAGTYTGNYLDVMQAAYGEYLARVVACPAIGDTEHSMSAPASTLFTAIGEQSDPSIEYFWDSFTDTLNLQLANAGDYVYEAFPAELEVTCTNDNDPADVVVATLADVSEDNVNLAAALTPGETYTITAHAVSDSAYVTNTTTEDVTVAESLTVDDLNILTAGYSYSHDQLNYPLIWTTFDPEAGGDVGNMAGFAGTYTFTCTPTTPSAGSAYTYTVSLYYVDKGSGSMELYEDGTFKLSQTGFAFVTPSSISGVWIENGDGTVTLNFDNNSFEEY